MAIETLHDDYLAFRDEYDGGNEEGFVVNDDSRAEWCCKKIAQAEANIARRKEFVDAEIVRLLAWQEQEDERDKATIDRMTGLLAPYFQHLRESGVLGKRKSYKLPSGTLQTRASGPKWKRVDNAALTKWAETHGLVRTKVEPAWSDIGKRLHPADDQIGAAALFANDDGELLEVPGVVLEAPAGETFSVKTEVQP